jgi:hypothetical protein
MSEISSAAREIVESPEKVAGSKVYVIVVNWNGWRDTIECLESVFRSSYSNHQVLLCDNGSTDGSAEQIRAWAQGQLVAKSLPDPVLQSLIDPPLSKPISFVEYNRSTAEAGGDGSNRGARLVLIHLEENLGFAGANNVALRLALSRKDFAYVWLLNNDTIVTPNALAELVQRLEERPSAGLCASTLLYYHAPGIVQVYGGTAYNRWFASMRPLGKGQPAAAPVDRQRIERLMDYPAGASVLVRRDFLETVGLLAESYFLYFEELDWVIRARKKFDLAYSPGSIVYHKEGRSIQAVDVNAPFHKADYYAHRNRLRHTRRYFPIGLPTVWVRTLGAVLTRLWRRQPRRAWGILQLMFSPETYRFPQQDRGQQGGGTKSGA